MYKYLATCEAGADYDASLELAHEAKLERVLQSTALGGKPEWQLADFLEEDIWETCGEQAGMKAVSRKFMALIAAGGQDGRPINPVCGECGELKCLHKGDRLNLSIVACKCDEVQQPQADDVRQRPSAAEEKPAKRSRGFGDDLDPNGEGIAQTYARKLEQIGARYPSLVSEPGAILKKLLGCDVSIDEPPKNSRNDAPPVTGELGGRILGRGLLPLLALAQAAQLPRPVNV